MLDTYVNIICLFYLKIFKKRSPRSLGVSGAFQLRVYDSGQRGAVSVRALTHLAASLDADGVPGALLAGADTHGAGLLLAAEELLGIHDGCDHFHDGLEWDPRGRHLFFGVASVQQHGVVNEVPDIPLFVDGSRGTKRVPATFMDLTAKRLLLDLEGGAEISQV